MNKLLAWRSVDGASIVLSSGVVLGLGEYGDGKRWVIYAGDVELGCYETESEAHFVLDQIWKDIKESGIYPMNLADEMFKSQVANKELLKDYDEVLEHQGEYSV